jgi:hypothetical protein
VVNPRPHAEGLLHGWDGVERLDDLGDLDIAREDRARVDRTFGRGPLPLRHLSLVQDTCGRVATEHESDFVGADSGVGQGRHDRLGREAAK